MITFSIPFLIEYVQIVIFTIIIEFYLYAKVYQTYP